MEEELIRIFDEQLNPLGVASREEVHRKGYWHETFHCWVISRERETDYIHLQLRSKTKKDFPDLLDITAAGHILSHETMEDGVREVEEELGISVNFEELLPLGIIQTSITIEEFIDREHCHVFLLEKEGLMNSYKMQKEEVGGIAKAELNPFFQFCLGQITELKIEGYQLDEAGENIPFSKVVNQSHFVPHEKSYLHTLVERLKGYNY